MIGRKEPEHLECKTTPQREIRYLSFSGGGWRTIAAIGVIEALHETGAFKNVVGASFCSGSSTLGFYLMGGYTAAEMKDFVKEQLEEYPDPDKANKEDGFVKRNGKKLADAGIFLLLIFKIIVNDINNSFLKFVLGPVTPEKNPYYAANQEDGLVKRIGKRLANAGIFTYLHFKKNPAKVKNDSLIYFIPEHADPEKNPYYTVKKEDNFVKRASKKIVNAGIFAYLFLKNTVDACRSRGIFHTKGIEEAVWKVLKNSPRLPDRLKKRDLTFSEYHHYKAEFRQKYPDFPCLDCYFAIAESTKKGYQLKYYSYESTPDFPIIKAVCAAMRIPKLFRRMQGVENLADGGIVDVTARTAFDGKRYFDSTDVNTDINMRTLSFYFVGSEDSITRWRDKCSDPQPLLSTTDKLLLKLLGAEKYVKDQNKAHHEGANALRTLFLDTSDISTFDLDDVTRPKYLEVCRKANASTREYLKFYVVGVACPHAPQEYPQEQKGQVSIKGVKCKQLTS